MKLFQLHRRAPGWPLRRIIGWWTCVRGMLRLLLTLIYRLQVRGFEHVPRTGPIIYVSNHQSHFDPVLVGIVAYDRPFSGVARATLFKSKLLGWLMRSIGVIAIEKGKGDKGAMDAALKELAAGRCVCIFPEGTRTPDGAIGEFQRGVMLLIKRSDAQVVPVAMEGAFDIWPIGQARPKLTGRIALQAAPAISAAELFKDGADAGLDRLRRTIDVMRLQLRTELRRKTGGRYPAPGAGDVTR